MSTTLIPEPGVLPDLVPDMIPDATITAMLDQAQAEMLIGVVLGPPGHVYTYIGLPGVKVGSVVLVPANSVCPTPQQGDVVTLRPRVPPGIALKRILAVLS